MSVSARNTATATPSVDPAAATVNLRPAATKVSSVLMQDVVPSGAISVGDGPHQVALFANPFRSGLEEAVIVDAQGRLTHLRRSDTSPTGWEQAVIPAGASGMAEVVVAPHPDGTVWAVAAATNGTLLTLLLGADGSWTSTPQNLPAGGWSNLHVSYVPGTPPVPMIYGADPGGTTLRVLYATVPVNGVHWIELSTALSSTLGDFTLARSMGTTNYRGWDSTATWLLRSAKGTTFDTYSLRVDPTSSVLTVQAYQTSTPTPMLAPVGGFQHPNGLGTVYLRTDGQLLLTWPSSWPNTGSALVPTDFSEAVMWIDTDGMMHVYGIDSTGTLSVLHQNGWASAPSDTVPAWTQATTPNGVSTPIAVPMASGVASVTLDPAPDLVPNLLVKFSGVPAQEAYALYSQDLTTTGWAVERVRRAPTDSAVDTVTRYTSDVTVVDAFGSPMPGLPVDISADTLTEVYVGGTSYLVGPRNSAQLTTDPQGKVTLSVPARGLTCPELTVSAQGLDGGAGVRPATDVQAFLAGDGTLPGHAEPLTGPALQAATVDGDPLVPSWDNMPSPDQVASSLQDVFSVAAGKPLTARPVDGYTGDQQVIGFAIQTWDSSRPVYRAFVADHELAAHRDALTLDARYGGWWDDAAKWFSDLWESVKDVGSKVWDLVVSVVEGVAEIVLEIGGALVKFVVDIVTGDFDGAAHVAEALFQQIKARVDRVIDWLKALFSFTDIWDTKTAIETMLLDIAPRTITTVADYLGHKVVGGWFAEQEAAVTHYFETMKAQLGDRTLGQVRDSGKASVPGPAGAVTPSPAAAMDNPQVKWLNNQVFGSSGTSSAVLRTAADSAAVGAVADIWTAFWGTLTASPAWGSFQKSAEDLGELVGDLFQVGGSGNTPNVALATLIDLVENAAVGGLQLLDSIVQAAVNALDAMAGTLVEFLNTPIDFGFLNTLYEWFQTSAYPDRTPEPLTLGGLACLLFAFPVTLAYKLLAGADAKLFPGGTVPTPPTPFAGLGDRPADAAPSDVQWPVYPLSITMQMLQSLGQFVYAVIDGLSDSLFSESETLQKGAAIYNFILLVPIGMPVWTMANPTDTTSDYYKGYCLMWGQWSFWVLQCVLDLAAVWNLGRLTKNSVAYLGTAVNCVTGLGALACGVSGNIYANGTSSKEAIEAFIGPILGNLSNATQPIRMFFNPEKGPISGAIWAAKAIGDMVTDFGAGVIWFMPPITEIFSPPTVTTGQTATFPKNKESTYKLQGGGGWGSNTWSATNLPTWLTLDPTTGTLKGTPGNDAAASTPLNVTVTDGFSPPGSASGTVTVTVSASTTKRPPKPKHG